MTIMLAENLRGARKAHGLTQEQLAEAMGVSVAAVSKWETGASAPELTMLVELAAFFEMSVDALLGYGWEAGGMGRAVERLRMYCREKRYDEGAPEAEKALKKYPNSFKVVRAAATLLGMMGIERGDHRVMHRAIELYRRACELIDQNTDEHIGVVTLQNEIAQLELCMGEFELAVEQLKSNNLDGLNDDIIGYTYATALHRPEEALPYLGNALVSKVTGLFRVVIGQINVFASQKRHGEALDMLRWLIGLYEGLRRPGPTMLDKYVATLLICCAKVCGEQRDYDAVRDYMVQAREMAMRFDAAPDYGIASLRFYYGKAEATSYDSLGGTAMEALQNAVCEETDPELLRIWKELNVQ